MGVNITKVVLNKNNFKSVLLTTQLLLEFFQQVKL